jgi:ferredoxin-NADP reductase
VTSPSDWLTLRVRETKVEADDVLSIVLDDPDGAGLPPWRPGAHVDVHIPAGFTPAGFTRQYSLCGDPAEPRTWRISVLREENSRGGSRYLHETVGPGTRLRLGRPRNNFPLEPSRRYEFIAGGIGVTPLLPMIAELDRRGGQWRLHYGGRRRDRMAFLDELAGYGDRVTVWPQDERGLLPVAEITRSAGSDGLVYCCGPEPLLDAVERACAELGTTPRVERFQPRPPTAAERADRIDRAFAVLVGGTGQLVEVAADQSILDALVDAGLDLPSSCREGTCASCETTVLDGDVDHRDSVLSEAERLSGTTMMICVSRAHSERLTLDL